MNRLFAVSAISLLAACSVNDQGLQQLKAGRNAEAFQSFTRCAQQGNPWCYNNLGVMYERGLVSGRVEIEQAVRYYTLAARYGVPLAQQNLMRLGSSVPRNDLQQAYQEQQARKAAAMRAFGDQLVKQANQPYQPATQPATSYSPSPAPAGTTAQIVPAKCRSDSQCGSGRLCVRPAGSLSDGICVLPVDDLGIRSYDIPEMSLGPHEYPSCQSFSDCPLGFECFRAQGWFNGLCMKR